jgi:hypothetical protein
VQLRAEINIVDRQNVSIIRPARDGYELAVPEDLNVKLPKS